jgi:hypothetical protein
VREAEHHASPEHRASGKPTEFTNAVFDGVQGYSFQNDAFGNIILGLETVSIEHFLAEFGVEISESYRASGAPGPWAANLGTAPAYLRERGIRSFVLTSSCGLSGWILAKEISVTSAKQTVPADHATIS